MTTPDEATTPGTSGQVAAPPGGLLLAVAKRGAERVLWARVALQRRAETRRGYAANRPVPRTVEPTAILRTRADWERAVAEGHRLRLPLHRDQPKNWDALGAVGAVLTLADDGTRSARVMDAGSARYSPVLPWLRLYGLGDQPGSLLGINLEFGDEVRRDGVVFRHGDVTATGLPDGSLDAITCMSVIEHGVPIEGFLSESARVLRPGGVLCVSTDYDQEPPDTTGRTAYGSEVKIFAPEDIRQLVATAERVGLELVGDLSTSDALSHEERPVHWDRVGLDYTFILLTFRRR
ncbi:class I SAM-dependent methyltransferase [Pedococcus sp. KACC 23699]|uniref:Class I SAM-dependent methyltransferase n=1 Tax=Pedococcus sp. KACC 23699 TaxID=3149228 RepID=A0AAU7JWB7_9MICO